MQFVVLILKDLPYKNSVVTRNERNPEFWKGYI